MESGIVGRRQAAAAVVRPEFHQLETFLAVVEAGSFASAAREMSRTQPAISQVIARLEEIYGGDLFERRRGAALVLTAIGEAILPSARAILHTVDQQMVQAAEAAQSRSGHLALGFFPGLASGPLRTGLSGLMRASPDVKLQLVENFPGELYRLLNERAVDLIVVGLMPNLASRNIETETLWEERLVLALPATHPMAGADTFRWKDVAALPLIIRSSHDELMGYRAMLRLVSQCQIDCEQHLVSRDALLDMVGMGMGATIMMKSGVVPHDNVAFRPIAEESAKALVEAVWPRNDQPTAAPTADPSPSGSEALMPVATQPFPATAPVPDRG